MELARRPYVTACVALAAASLIAVTPVAPTPLPNVQLPAVQLTAASVGADLANLAGEAGPVVNAITGAGGSSGLFGDLLNPGTALTDLGNVQPVDPDLLASALVSIPQLPPAVADAAIFDPAAAAGSIGGAIEALYLAIEPWVQYGFDLVSYAVGFVPFVGVLAPQIMFFYDLGEPIVQSLLFNTIDFLSGTVSFGEALSNFATATADAFSTFVNTEINWVLSFLPPLPPLPPFPLNLGAADPSVHSLGAVDPSITGDLTGLFGGGALDPSTVVSDLSTLLNPADLSNLLSGADFSAVFDPALLGGLVGGLAADVGGMLSALIP